MGQVCYFMQNCIKMNMKYICLISKITSLQKIFKITLFNGKCVLLHINKSLLWKYTTFYTIISITPSLTRDCVSIAMGCNIALLSFTIHHHNNVHRNRHQNEKAFQSLISTPPRDHNSIYIYRRISSPLHR